MRLRYRIIQTNDGLYHPQYFEGIWIFGKWYAMTNGLDDLKEAEQKIISVAHTVIASHDKIVRTIIVT